MPEFQSLQSSPNVSLRPFRSLVFAGLLCGAWVAAWWLAARSADRIPRPFVFWDVALVSVLCGIPVGLVLAETLLKVSRMLGMLLAALGLALCSLLFLDLPDLASLGWPWLAQWFWGGLVGLSSAILAAGFQLSDDPQKTPNWPLWSILLLIPLLSIASWTYAADRARYHEKTIQKYLGQSRFQEARELILKLRALDPNRKLGGEPLSETAAELNQQIKLLREEARSIEAELAKSGEQDAAKAEELRIRLAENLAMLGETDKATLVLNPLVETDPPSPAALNLLGTILEHQERWSESLRYYEQAREELQEEPGSSEQQAKLVRAWKGIAYANRNQNQHMQAEAAYRKVLEIEPSAANHFLMAQFYENAQQGDKAQHHAYLAAELDPAFGDKADLLVNDLQGNQFGCWGVFQNRRNLLSR